MRAAVADHKIDTVMHLRQLAYVGESVEQPLRYYRNNVDGLLSVLEACEAAGVERFVFSSSCSTYGQPPEAMIPIPEHCPQNPVSPYGRTKLQGEQIIKDFADGRRMAGKPFGYVLLRYFNVAGCDRSGVLGEDHTPESHLVPVVLQAAARPAARTSAFSEPTIRRPTALASAIMSTSTTLRAAHALAMNKVGPGDGLFYNVGISAATRCARSLRPAADHWPPD